MADYNETIIGLADDVDPPTRRDMLTGALGSQQDVTKSFTIPQVIETT